MIKIILLLLVSISGFAQIDTIKQNKYFVCDTIGLRIIDYKGLLTYHIENDDSYGGLSVMDLHAYNNNIENSSSNYLFRIQTTAVDVNLVSYYNRPNNLGTRFYLNGYDAKFYDTRPTKKGIQYNENGYVTNITSLTDKEYVDRNQLRKFTKTTLPPPIQGQIIYVTNALGFPCPAYSDGTNWRRFSDNSIIN